MIDVNNLLVCGVARNYISLLHFFFSESHCGKLSLLTIKFLIVKKNKGYL